MSDYTLRERFQHSYYKLRKSHERHPIKRFATWLAYKWGINSRDTPDQLEYLETRGNGDVVYYNADLQRFMVIPKENHPDNE